MLGVLAAIVVGTVVGLVVLFPSGEDRPSIPGFLAQDTEQATVTAVEPVECPGTIECANVTFRIESGEDRGMEETTLTGITTFEPVYEEGDRLRVLRFDEAPRTAPPPGTDEGATAPAPPDAGAAASTYTIVDFERRSPMLWLALIFAGLVVLVGRLRGTLSLLGILVSLAIVIGFVAPAILEGTSPLATAIVGASAIMLVTIFVTHGPGPQSVAASLGTAASFLLTAFLALAFFELANITGFSSEEATFLGVGDREISLQGLVLAGAVIAALGVLDDATISQSSVVVALKRANPGMRFRELFTGAIEVGRDHVAATVNTLVLAYAGASLPVLLIFSVQGTGFGAAVNSEVVAKEIVATLVGSIGIVAAVPLTTALAALLVQHLSEQGLQDADAHGHAHVH